MELAGRNSEQCGEIFAVNGGHKRYIKPAAATYPLPFKPQQNLFRQILIFAFHHVPDHHLRIDVCPHGIPIGKPNDLGFAALKIKTDFPPFAVVVCLVRVDSGGVFLFPSFLRFQLQPNAAQDTVFDKKLRQMFYGSTVSTFCTSGCRSLEHDRQIFKGRSVLP